MSVFWKPRGVVADYEFAELKGDKVYDLSGNGNHGTVYGAVWRGGPLIGALSFDGVDDYIEIPDSPSINVANNSKFTVETLFNPLSWADNTYLRILYAYSFGFYFYNNFLKVIHRYASDSSYHVSDIATSLPAGETGKYHTLTVIVDQTALTAEAYLDGVYQHSVGIDEEMPASSTWYIGQVTGYYFNGMISLFRIYNRILTEKEIKAHANYLLRYTPKRRITKELLI